MSGPRTLFLQHEQRRYYWEEPGHLELYLPMVGSGLLGEVRTIPYQRDMRWILNELDNGANSSKLQHLPAAGERLRLMLDAQMREFRPDLVVYSLTWVQEALPPEVLGNLKDAYGFKLFSQIWDYDESNPLLVDYDRRIIAVSDLVSIADSRARIERIRRREPPYANYTNVDVVRFLPTIPEPGLFKPAGRRRFGVTIAGSSEGRRVEVVRALAEAGVDFHRAGGLVAGDAFLSTEEYARTLAESKIVINTQTAPERVQLKGRVAQVLSCGSFLLEERNPESEQFLDGYSVDLWSNPAELVDKIQWWLAHPAQRELAADLARARYVREHNPVTYTRTILDAVGL
ncbi:MAG: glycosyltransferase family 1 protein [Chloroflexi bacterium]|nr:glycosyltransferase family 1 protein [Chloroflexota bacterium]